jgi:general secretion pathway protein G
MMRSRRKPRPSGGFTLIELVITVALVGLMAVMALPLYDVATTRMKESDLRHALRTIREGLDTYKAAVEEGRLAGEPETSGYPPSLDVLTEPLELISKRDLSGSLVTRRLVILRQLPRDPFHPDIDVPAAQTWRTRAYASRSNEPQTGNDVYDVWSWSDRTALDGTKYSNW